jgi:hypothetical protein
MGSEGCTQGARPVDPRGILSKGEGKHWRCTRFPRPNSMKSPKRNLESGDSLMTGPVVRYCWLYITYMQFKRIADRCKMSQIIKSDKNLEKERK